MIGGCYGKHSFVEHTVCFAGVHSLASSSRSARTKAVNRFLVVARSIVAKQGLE